MRIWILAGEPSGDEHGAGLAAALRRHAPEAQIIGTGSDRMRAAGVEIVADPTRFASIGFVDAARNYRHYAALFRRLCDLLRTRRPDVVVLVDFAEFNLRFARRLAAHEVPAAYYIPPQVWAWRPGRARAIGRRCREVLAIFPFEPEFYARYGVHATFVGHPLVEQLAGVCPAHDLRDGRPIVALLPGSRRTQFAALLPRMAQAAARVPGPRYVVAAAPALDPAWVERLRRSQARNIEVLRGRARELLAAADAALVASGTATLEAAILGVPMAVTYWVQPVAAFAAAPLLRTPYLALPNIVAGREIVPERYQWRARPEELAAALREILSPERAARMRRDLAEVRARLGPPGASERAAQRVLALARGAPAPGRTDPRA